MNEKLSSDRIDDRPVSRYEPAPFFQTLCEPIKTTVAAPSGFEGKMKHVLLLSVYTLSGWPLTSIPFLRQRSSECNESVQFAPSRLRQIER